MRVHTFCCMVWSNADITEIVCLHLQVVYGTAVAPANTGFSPLAPLAAGLAIYVAEEASGGYTGSPLNPARLIGPALVFFCNWRHFWAWMLGECAGSRCPPLHFAGD